MSWTVLRVVKEGVVLRAAHARRFARETNEVRAKFDRFCAEAAPGIYGLRVSGRELDVLPREEPWLVEGMPVRSRVSPLAAAVGPIPKPASPSPYDAVRERGTCTLLMSANSLEFYEACTAALVSWDGARFVLAPGDRPRVASTAEATLRAALPFVERPLAVSTDVPLFALNAVSGPVALRFAGRAPMPAEAMDAVRLAFRAETSR